MTKLFTIAPHAPFLASLAERVLDGTLLGDWPRTGPFWLSDVTIILPTRRAASGFADAILAMNGAGTLLPDIRTFGGEVEDEEPFLPPHDLGPMPLAIPPVARRLLLSELIGQWQAQNPDRLHGGEGTPNPIEVLALADSLARLIDDFVTEQVDLMEIAGLEIGGLNDYWQQSQQFLEIVFQHWPDMLAQYDRIDQSAVRNERLRREALAAPLVYGERPVIAAGSTGSIPATAELMRAIAALPRGALVLPGLDTRLSAQSLALLADKTRAPHGHAQFHLAALLRRLGTQPDAATELAADPGVVRTHAVRQALALAPETRHWPEARASLGEGEVRKALSGIGLAAAHGEQEQALAVALAAAGALREDKQVGIVAPDRNLARRIVSELQRFGIEVDDSAGTPLSQSRAGRLARQAIAAAATNFAPVDLMALLRNRHVTLGQRRADIGGVAEKIEFGLLRGQRPAPGLDGLRQMLALNIAEKLDHPALDLHEADHDPILALLDGLDRAMQPLTGLMEGAFRPAALAGALVAVIDALGAAPEGETPPELPGLAELRDWVEALAAAPLPGPQLEAESAAPAFEQLVMGLSVRQRRTPHPKISIWGRLEARLQPADLMILTALNEGTWPEVADPGPWLSRQMRLAVGLEPPERQHGLAAHDFEMALGTPEVLLTYAERVGTSPATPSRLVQRLTGFAGEKLTEEMRARGQVFVAQARRADRMDAPPQPAARPEPRPPAGKRTRNISITRVEQLIRSPYDLYARHTLKLTALTALGEAPGARDRGTLIHEVFKHFVREGHDPVAPDAHEKLMALAGDVFTALESLPDRRDIWLRRFAASARDYLGFERERAGRVRTRHAEIDLEHTFPVAGVPFRLYGRADRIDMLHDGTVEIIDFKTGAPPTSSDMKALLAPQLPLEAFIVAQEGFTSGKTQVAPMQASALTYLRLGTGQTGFELKPFVPPGNLDLMGTADAIMERLSRHIQKFLLTDDEPMTIIMPRPSQRFEGDYDHLARVKEWTAEAEEDET